MSANMFKDKTILITGGTGFLGRNLIRRILPLGPGSIRVYSRDENKHYNLQKLFPGDEKIRSLIGDVRDFARLCKACEGVDIVIHAAALKQISLIEYNIEEAIKTNILGTLNLVRAAQEQGVKRLVYVSTDKACSPANTYGACKMVGERIVTESNYNKGKNPIVMTTVRYGNVLESTGSVIPFFREKITAGAEIPLTDKEMTRFMISADEAVDHIFKTLECAIGGEIFVPKLNSFRITDLIEVVKAELKATNPVKIIGARPGEKVHEILVSGSEMVYTYQFREMYIITSLIQSYQQLKNIPYIQKGTKVKTGNGKEYSSKDCLVSKDDLAKYLKTRLQHE